MALLTNHVNQFLRIFVPDINEYRIFDHGRLSIEETDPAYEVVMKEARRNPLISILGEEGERLKVAARYGCDLDGLGFQNEAELVAHNLAMHADPPVLTEGGEALDDTHGVPRHQDVSPAKGRGRAKGRDQEIDTVVPPARGSVKE